MKRLLAAAATVLLLGGALWYGGRGATTGDRGAESPAECLERMFSAAEQGDVDAYLQCFGGPQRDEILARLKGQSRDVFAQSLVDAVGSLKGRAQYGPSVAPEAVSAEWTVERVYHNRHERQVYRLSRDRGGWRVVEVDVAQPFQPPMQYGASVFEESRP